MSVGQWLRQWGFRHLSLDPAAGSSLVPSYLEACHLLQRLDQGMVAVVAQTTALECPLHLEDEACRRQWHRQLIG